MRKGQSGDLTERGFPGLAFPSSPVAYYSPLFFSAAMRPAPTSRDGGSQYFRGSTAEGSLKEIPFQRIFLPIYVVTSGEHQATSQTPRRGSLTLQCLQFHVYRLNLGVELDRMFPQLSSEPGLFVAAEWGNGIDHVVAVDPH